jgi:predicted short-subunit dehydrogenase-like oxidoreductase (DUF2520 family)
MTATAKKKESSKRISTSFAFVGSGRLASYLAIALHERGYKITEIIGRDQPASRRRARALAARVGAKVATTSSASLDATVLWFGVPDREILPAANAIAGRLSALERAGRRQKNSQRRRKFQRNSVRFAFHSSGALLSQELAPLRAHGTGIASAHPLMTFVAGSNPSLAGVPFALEGDPAAVRLARAVVRSLGVESFQIQPAHKAAYHAWATMTSPLLLAFLVTLEEAARAAGFSKQDARGKSLAIIHQTIANYASLGPAASFSGPLIRGDVRTIAQHLLAFRKHPGVREVYLALARSALRGLPVKNKEALRDLLKS